MMDSSNLINPFCAAQQKAWHRWWFMTWLWIGALGAILMALTGYQLWHIQCLKKEISIAQSAVNNDAVTQRNTLQEQHKRLEIKLAKIQHWQRISLHSPLKALSDVIPGSVMLTAVDVQEHAVTLRGRSSSIEFVLEFLHNLEKTKLFSSMTLQELQPCLEDDHEKKLVNFVIKGKLEFKTV
jgi:Tfp pilus assembly protein PilN